MANELTMEEIAIALKVPEQTIKVWMRLGCPRSKGKFNKQEIEEWRKEQAKPSKFIKTK